jgi:hypothetical protein
MELTKEEVYAIMQSDMKLWEVASTESDGNDITKRLTLPMGIGEVAIQFTGVDNAIKRRAAAEQWGATIREAIRDVIDDDAITARAKQQAALSGSEDELEEVGSTDSGHGDSDEPVSVRGDAAVPSAATEGTVQAHAEHAQGNEGGPGGTDFAARAEWLRGEIEAQTKRLRAHQRELRALEAALSVLGDDEE